jgi:hypothetical protein
MGEAERQTIRTARVIRISFFFLGGSTVFYAAYTAGLPAELRTFATLSGVLWVMPTYLSSFAIKAVLTKIAFVLCANLLRMVAGFNFWTQNRRLRIASLTIKRLIAFSKKYSTYLVGAIALMWTVIAEAGLIQSVTLILSLLLGFPIFLSLYGSYYFRTTNDDLRAPSFVSTWRKEDYYESAFITCLTISIILTGGILFEVQSSKEVCIEVDGHTFSASIVSRDSTGFIVVRNPTGDSDYSVAFIAASAFEVTSECPMAQSMVE